MDGPRYYEVIHKPLENRLEIELGEKNAVLVYSIRVGLFIILNTYVPPAFRRRGLAGNMATAALEYAKGEGLKVRSYCSFTTYFIETHTEYKELMG